jgi:hypothetical protein
MALQADDSTHPPHDVALCRARTVLRCWGDELLRRSRPSVGAFTRVPDAGVDRAARERDPLVRVAVAVAEGEGKTWRECAAAELIVDADVAPTRWELVPTLAFATPGGGYRSEVGVACFAPTDWLTTGPMSARDLLPPPSPGWQQHDDDDGDDDLSLVLFTVGPQHGECLTFAGYDDAGRITRVATDLGLLDLDPRTHPLPW